MKTRIISLALVISILCTTVVGANPPLSIDTDDSTENSSTIETELETETTTISTASSDVYTVTGNVTNSSDTRTFENAITAHLDVLSEQMDTLQKGTESDIYWLAMISNLYQNIYFLSALESDTVSEATLKNYVNKSQQEITEYLARYPYDTDDDTSSIFIEDYSDTNNDTYAKHVSSQIEDILTNNISTMVTDKLFDIMNSKSEYKLNTFGTSNSYNLELIVTENPYLLVASQELYSFLNDYEEKLQSLQELKSQEESLNIKDTLVNFISNIYNNITSFFKDLNEDFIQEKAVEELLEYANNYTGPSLTVSDGLVKVEQKITENIEALANVVRKGDSYSKDFSVNAWAISDGTSDITLSSAYLAMLASTSVYTPFRSRVGDADYISALESLAPAESKESLIATFSEIKDLKKPLYSVVVKEGASLFSSFNNSNDVSSYSGSTTRATLGDFVTYAENQTNVGYVTIKGSFEQDNDVNSWAFFQASNNVNSASDNETEFQGKKISADDVVSTDTYTDILFSMGSSSGMPTAGLLLFQNLYTDLRNTSFLSTQENALLYMNVFGDIVLADDTVIIPGASNPAIYSTDSAYNPYTVAFMNSYPKMTSDADSIGVFTSSDKNKFLLFMDKDSASNQEEFVHADSYFHSKEDLETIKNFGADGLSIRQITGNKEIASKLNSKAISVFPFFYNGSDNYQTFVYLREEELSFFEQLGDFLNVFKNEDRYAVGFKESFIYGQPLFPYYSSDISLLSNNDYTSVKAIAQNMYWYYTYDANFKSTSMPNANLRMEYLFSNLVIEMLQGTPYVSVFEKNIQISNVILDDNSNFISRAFLEVAKALLQNLEDIQGSLGILPADINPVFGEIIKVFRTYSTYFYLFFITIFIFRYAKRGDLTYTTIVSTLACSFFFIFVYIIPTMLPVLYNTMSHLVTEQLVTDILLYNTESYSTTYGKATEFGINDDYETQTVSITIYKMSEAQLKAFSDKYNVPYNNFRYGERVIIDPDIGLYIQGDSLKINLDVLFYNNPITGGYEESEYGIAYNLVASKMSSSVMDYYNPYYILQEGLVETLNALLSNYNVARQTSNYLDGLVKDSFVLYNYATSIPFLYGDNMRAIDGLSPGEYLKLEQVFPDPMDFLKMTEWIDNPTDEIMETIWYRTMLEHGYYDPIYGEERRQDLISYVNYHTKLFLIRNMPDIGTVSDENIIKITSLQATFLFNTRISQLGNVVYPIAYNQEEIKLDDVFLTTITTDTDRYIAHHFDIINYISNTYGTIGLILFSTMILIATAVVLVMNFSLPVLYLYVVVNLIFRLIFDKPIAPIIKGYIKVNIGLIGVYTLFIIIITQLPKYLDGFSMLLVLVLGLLLIRKLLFVVLKGVILDLKNLGNTGIQKVFHQNRFLNLLTVPISNTIHKFQNRYTNQEHFDEGETFSEEGEGTITSSIPEANRQYIINRFDD